MAIVSDIEIRLRADIAQLRNDMRRAQSEVSGSVDKIRKSLLALAAGFSVMEIVNQIIKAQREFDKLNASLITATGSTKAAGEAMKALQSFAAKTPFSLQEVTEGFLKLRNLGLTPSERALESYGNTSAAMGKSLTQLVEAVADAATGEFERLKEFGIKSKQQGDMVAFTFQGTTTKVKNSAADIEEYLTKIGEVNFAGGMKLQADTLDGAISALGDTWSQTLVAFSQSGFGDGVRSGVMQLSDALVDLQAMFIAARGAADDEGDSINKIGPLHAFLTTTFEALTVLGINLAHILKTIGGDIGAIGAAVVAFAKGDFAAARNIIAMRIKDGEAELADVNARSAAILGAAANAKAAREKEAADLKQSGIDRLAQYKILSAGAKTYLMELERLQGALAKGTLSQEQYVAAVSKLAKETYDTSVALTDEQIKAAKKAAEEAKKLAEKQSETYKALLVTLEDRVASTARELAGLLPLNEAEKSHIELTREIASGKLKLTAAQKMRAESLIDEARANEVLAKSNKEFEDLQQQLIKNSAELASERYKLIESAKEEAEQNELAIEIYGMSEAAIIRLTASRLMDQEAQRLGRALTADEIADLQRVIDLKERSAKAVANKAELESTKAFWSSVEKTAHDTFVSIADGGKNAFQRLKDTAKNTFFDWLYQQTIKKWIINIGTSVTGAGVAGAAQAAGGGISSVSGIASLIGSVKGIGSGALQTAGAVLTGQAGLGSTISAGFSALASGTASGITAGLSSLAGTLGPIALGIAGAAKLLSSAFGRGPKELTGNSKLTGSLTAAGFSGSFQDEWKKKGGWFSSSKTGFDSRAVGNEVSMMLDTTYDAIKSSSADYARMLGLNADAISNRAQSISIAMGKDEAANQKAIADFFTGVANTVAGELLPEIGKFQMAGEEASSTLQRLATNYAGLDQVLAIMGSTSQKAFGAVGVASIEARERLIAFAGGLEALASQTTFFNQNFLSQAEQIAIVQKPLNEALANLGYAGITTADQFKSAVMGLAQSGALATAEGAKTYAGLLALAPAFKTVSDYLKEVSDAAAETAKDLEQVALAERERAEAAIQAAKEAALAQLEANEQVLRGLVDVALGVVQRSVEAQKNIVTKAYNDSMTALQARISSVGESISKITELSTLLKNSLGTVSSDAQQGASRAAARAQITTALAIAKASGVLPSADSLKDALSTINQDASDQFSSLLDYQREVARTNSEIEALGGLTDKQLTEAQMQLRLLEQTKALAEQQYADEMTRLDGIIEWAQAEVDAINGVNNSVMGVWQAMNGLNVALTDLKTGATPGNPGGSTLSVEQLYRDVLGREGEAAGISFWRKAFGSVVDSGEYVEFLKSAQPELDMIDRQKRQMESVATMPGSGTMSSNAESNSEEMKQMKSDMSRTAAAVEQLASQFNQVSGGGNSLLTEPA